MLKNAVIIFEESYMAKHIKLVIADDFIVIFLTENFKVILRSSQRSNTRTGESNL